MTQNQQFVQTLVTIGAAALVAMVAVIVAGRVATSKGSPWWAVLGGLAVCGGTVLVAYQIFIFVHTGSWSY